MNKVSVKSLNECFNVSGEDFMLIDDNYEVISSRIPHSEELKKAISDALKGNTNGKGNAGKTRSKELKERISNSLKKQWECGKFSNRINGHKKGKENAWYGRKHSEETIEKQRHVKCKFLYEVTSPSGEIYVVESLRNFCKNNNLTDRWMYATITGEVKHHKGWCAKKL